MKINVYFIFILAFFGFFQSNAQINVRDSAVSSWMFSIKLIGNISAGDLADRFGNSLGTGIEISRKTQSNWIFGVDGTYFFGNKVDNLYQIFGNLVTDEGLFIGLNGDLAGVEFFQRGFYTGAHIGKLFPIFGPNPNSGLLVKVGAGYLQNFIHIRKPNAIVPQIEDEYKKGYDRLHDGFALRQQISYMNSGSNRTVNFIVGFEFIEGFTKNARGYNYDTRMPDLDAKMDVYLGMHLTWFLPIYDKNQDKFYYY